DGGAAGRRARARPARRKVYHLWGNRSGPAAELGTGRAAGDADPGHRRAAGAPLPGPAVWCASAGGAPPHRPGRSRTPRRPGGPGRRWDTTGGRASLWRGPAATGDVRSDPAAVPGLSPGSAVLAGVGLLWPALLRRCHGRYGAVQPASAPPPAAQDG